jgi:hypothetical protein
MINGKHRKKVRDKKVKALAIKKDARDRAKEARSGRSTRRQGRWPHGDDAPS